jgi:hypothetical protein
MAMTIETNAQQSAHASSSAEERVALVERIHITFPRLDRVRDRIAFCHRHSKLAAEPECMLVTGDTGAGKTTLLRRYARQFPPHRSPEGATVPVLATSIPVPATAKSLATRLLVALGDPLAERGTTVTQTLRLARLMRACGVELLILDEFQHFIDRDSNHVLQTAANWLKDLLNETNVPVVLAGMPSSDVILRANAQLERRFAVRTSIEPFSWRTSAEQTEFRTFLRVLDRQLPLERASPLDDLDTALRIFSATGGVLGSLMTLVRRATVLAVDRSLPCLDLELFAEAYDERLAARFPARPNPLRADVEQLRTQLEADVPPGSVSDLGRPRRARDEGASSQGRRR